MSRILRFALLALCCMWLALAACDSSTTVHVPTVPPTQSATRPSVAVTVTAPQVVAPTAVPEDAFRHELGALTTLRGRFIGGPGAEIEALADVTIVHVNDQLASPSLADAQWDAFVIQQALWTGQEFTIPAGWEVSVQVFVPSADPNASPLGRYIGVANLHTASARQLSWDRLSPRQAWGQYDGTQYSPTGL
jgi:hypothetical protein